MKQLLSTKDKTDRTNEIQRILAEEGVCRLGSGDFYVGNLVMPNHTMLVGNGAATRLILLENIEDGYVVSVRTRCTVKDMFFVGSEEPIEVSEQVGTRHGIMFVDTSEKGGNDAPSYGTIENCHMTGFSGGAITCLNTGYHYKDSLNVTDCWMTNCGVGIHIPFWSEFHRFNNISAMGCWYGCINNGGNNMFSNCNFSGNEVGFLIDNSRNQSKNNSHGSAIGCVFNHSGNNKGTGIRILGIKHGYIFSGCQVFYSKIELEDVDGVVFDIWDCSNKEADCYWIIDRSVNVALLEKIEAYLNSINIEMLSMEELEHYTKILIAIENKRLEDMHRTEILKQFTK